MYVLSPNEIAISIALFIATMLPTFLLRRLVFRDGLRKKVAIAVAAFLTVITWFVIVLPINFFLVPDGPWRGGVVLWALVFLASTAILRRKEAPSEPIQQDAVFEVEDSTVDEHPKIETRPGAVQEKRSYTSLLLRASVVGTLLSTILFTLGAISIWQGHIRPLEQRSNLIGDPIASFAWCVDPQPTTKTLEDFNEWQELFGRAPVSEETFSRINQEIYEETLNECELVFGDLLNQPDGMTRAAWRDFPQALLARWHEALYVYAATQVWVTLLFMTARVSDSGFKRLSIVLAPIATSVVVWLIAQEVREIVELWVAFTILATPIAFWVLISVARIFSWVKAGFTDGGHDALGVESQSRRS